MFTLHSTKAAYWAGVFDSDGSITIARRHLNTRLVTSYCPLFQLTWKDSEMSRKAISELKASHGGSYMTGKARSSIGKTDIIKYSLTGYRLFILLDSVIPFLQLKKQQAEIAMTVLKYNTSKVGRHNRSAEEQEFLHNTWEQIKALNKGVK